MHHKQSDTALELGSSLIQPDHINGDMVTNYECAAIRQGLAALVRLLWILKIRDFITQAAEYTYALPPFCLRSIACNIFTLLVPGLYGTNFT